ncbi:MAG: hypothetical protein IIW52_05125 [Alistipes sp.]|nr:hypothetical protein [Alistipes sp.]
MNRVIRNKILVQEIINRGICSSQKELGVLLGYENESYFSQIMTGLKTPKNFITKIKSLLPGLNEDWLLNGRGDMFGTPIESNVIVEGNGNAVGNNSINTATNSQLVAEITAQRRFAEKIQADSKEQIDRLLGIIEKLSNH